METIKYTAEIWVRTDGETDEKRDTIAKEMIKDGIRRMWSTSGSGAITKVCKIKRKHETSINVD